MKKRIISGLLGALLLLSVMMPGILAENLRYGSSGDQVNQAQTRLKELGYYMAEVDGKYGYSTMMAVRRFQDKNGLQVDGVIGENTNLVLFSSYAIAANGDTAAAPLYQRIAYGSEGPAVMTVQGLLRNLGYYTRDVEGKFGYSTYQAVVKFQRDRGLKVDGVVGPATWAALTGGVMPPPVPTGAPTATPNPMAGLPYKYNDVGPAVYRIQERLHQLGYNVGEVDDRFGYLTYLAVRAFQKNNALAVDGIVGLNTWNRLFGANPVPFTTLPPPVVLPTDAPATQAPATIRLEYGDSGPQVGQVQTRLFELGYLSNNVIDYMYGYETVQAVRAFQRRNSLAVDGIVGPATWRKLFGTGAIPAVTPAPAPTTAPTPAPGAVTPVPTDAPLRLSYGSSGALVTQLQNRLAALRYLSASHVDGKFGYETTTAVRSFQRANGLSVDGVVGQKTWDKLFSDSALPKPTATPKP